MEELAVTSPFQGDDVGRYIMTAQCPAWIGRRHMRHDRRFRLLPPGADFRCVDTVT
jgi:hypothetical protein